jgi:hypothetical protein
MVGRFEKIMITLYLGKNIDEIYSDDYLINFLKINTNTNQRVNM